MPDQLTIKEFGGSDAQTGTRLRETLSNGRRKATLIQAGWGSSGYYSESMLAHDGPVAFPQGLHMYLDHPTLSEEHERPERSLRDLVGATATTPRMEGIDLTAEVEIFSHWKPVIEEMAPHIGLSIRAIGEAEHGAAGGKEGPLVTALTEGISCDYVTAAGAGGKLRENANLIGLMEAARRQADDGELDEADLREAANMLDHLSGSIHQGFTDHADNAFKQGRLNRDERKHASAAIGTALDAFHSHMQTHAPQLGARDPYAQSTAVVPAATTKEAQVGDEERLSKLEESVRQLTEDKDEAEKKLEEAETKSKEEKEARERAEDKLLKQEAEKVVVEALEADETEARESGTGLLPDRAAKRVKESVLREKLPVNDDGDLKEDALKESVTKAAKEERSYLLGESDEEGKTKTTEGGVPVRENGSLFGNESEADEKTHKALVESFQAQGMSEDAAELAARGR